MTRFRCVDSRGVLFTVTVERARGWRLTGSGTPMGWDDQFVRELRDRLNAASLCLGLDRLPPLHVDTRCLGRTDLGIFIAGHRPDLLDGEPVVVGEMGLDGQPHPAPVQLSRLEVPHDAKDWLFGRNEELSL